MTKMSEKIFCPHVIPVEHNLIKDMDFYKVHCLFKVCPHTGNPDIICLSHNYGLNIISDNKKGED